MPARTKGFPRSVVMRNLAEREDWSDLVEGSVNVSTMKSTLAGPAFWVKLAKEWATGKRRLGQQVIAYFSKRMAKHYCPALAAAQKSQLALQLRLVC